MTARVRYRQWTVMHVHLLLHLHRTASMITHVIGAYPFTLRYPDWGNHQGKLPDAAPRRETEGWRRSRRWEVSCRIR